MNKFKIITEASQALQSGKQILSQAMSLHNEKLMIRQDSVVGKKIRIWKRLKIGWNQDFPNSTNDEGKVFRGDFSLVMLLINL